MQDKMEAAIHDLVMEAATKNPPLSDLLRLAYRAGYEGAVADNYLTHADHFEPDGTDGRVSPVEARRLLRQALTEFKPDTFLNLAAESEWPWCDEVGGWIPEGTDSTVRPGVNGIIVMEAAGEWSGKVIVDRDAKFATFPERTFR